MSKKRGEMSITKRIKLTNDLIYKMYNGGMTFAEIGEVLHLDKSTISRRFKNDKNLFSLIEKKKEEKSRVVDMLYENKERIKQLLSEGLSIDGVAMLLECKKSTLCYWLYEKGILNSNK